MSTDPVPMLEPMQDALELTGFGPVLGAFVLAHHHARVARPSIDPAHPRGRLSSTSTSTT